MAKRALPVFVLGLLAIGCVAVRIQSARWTNDQRTIEPLAFILFQRTTPERLCARLKEALLWDAAQRRIPVTVTIMSGLELDEDAVIERALAGKRGVILMAPIGGTLYYGQPISLLYDARAFSVVANVSDAGAASDGGPSPQLDGGASINGHALLDPIWRGRIKSIVDEARLADELLRRLVSDHVVNGYGGEIKLPQAASTTGRR